LSVVRLLVPYLAYLYIYLVGLTSRISWRGLDELKAARRIKGRVIFAFWHQRQVFFTWSHRGFPAAVLVSRSQDGEMIARTMALFGLRTCRGSSSRGGAAAIRGMLAALQAGLDIGISPDGPKGPAREIKGAILHLAQTTGSPIVPITNSVSRRLEFSKSWDAFQVPLPFSRVVVRHGPPITVGAADDLEAKGRELKSVLDRITEEADREARA
jgi:lysophospholipid acyltransferase (LPLAT)-like uncharacterized protein